MNRGEFLKILGISAIAPSVLILDGKEKKQIPIDKFNPKRWPIYPDRISFAVDENGRLAHTMFSYVKIKRNHVEYLVPIREVYIDDYEKLKDRFEFNAEQIREHYVVNDFMVDNKFIIEYNPLIHNN